MKDKAVKSISIVGAGGDIGREIARAVVYANILGPGDELQLVGREGGKSDYFLYGLNEDLLDANPDRALVITKALRPEDVRGDVIVVAASVPDPPRQAGSTSPRLVDRLVPREELAEGNCEIFESYAAALKKSHSRPKAVLIVSNPVELGVQIFGESIGRERVLGVGAWSDSKRLSREMAGELAASGKEAKAKAVVGGEHGPYMMPLLSYTRINRKKLMPEQTGRFCPFELRRLRGEFSVRENRLNDMLQDRRGIAAAFNALADMPAVMRVMLKSFFIHYSGAKTAAATASTVVDFVRAVSKGKPTNLVAQVIVDGVPIGVPVSLSSQGVLTRCSLEDEPSRRSAWRISDEERDALRWVSNRIDSSLLVTRLRAQMKLLLETTAQPKMFFKTVIIKERALAALETIARAVECGCAPVKETLALIELFRVENDAAETSHLVLAENYVKRWGDAADVQTLRELTRSEVHLVKHASVEDAESLAANESERSPLPPRYEILMCPPTFFHQQTVKFGINPYSVPGTPVDNEALESEFETWAKQLESLSQESSYCGAIAERVVAVKLIEPGRDLPLMVYAANGGVVLPCRDGRRLAFPASFTFPQRQGETEHYRRWFAENGFEVIDFTDGVRQEGEGDLLPVPGANIFFGAYGIRSDEEAYQWIESQAREGGCDIRVVTIPSVSEDFFHLDTYALFPGVAPYTGLQTAVVYPGATTPEGVEKIRGVCEDVIEVSEEEALTFVCNSVVFHFYRLVIMPVENQRIRAELEKRGFDVQTTYVNELFKGGGQAKCTVLFTDCAEKH